MKMKKALLIFLLVSGAAGSAALAQDFAAPLRHPREVSVPPYAPRIVREGGLQRVARHGNLAQAINPFAPRQYGTGQEFVEYRQNDPFLRPRDPSREHPVALRLLAFEF